MAYVGDIIHALIAHNVWKVNNNMVGTIQAKNKINVNGNGVQDVLNAVCNLEQSTILRAAYHPPPQRDLQYVFNQNGGIKQWADMEQPLDKDAKEGTIQPAATEVESITVQRAKFNRQKRKFDWLEHHYSKCTVKRGK